MIYTPDAFEETRIDVVHAFVRANSFGTLVSTGPNGLLASHLPFLVDSASGPSGTLRGHMARANTQWQSLGPQHEVLVMFQGPHAYVSPSWYATQKAVPTWNYTAVHCYGPARLIEPLAQVCQLLSQMVDTYESQLPSPWSMDRLPAEFVDQLVRGIVAFEIPINRIEAKWKLSQNRSVEDQAGAAQGLEQNKDWHSQQVAKLMRATIAGGGATPSLSR